MISDRGAVVTKRLSLELNVNEMIAGDLASALNEKISGLTANEITLPIIVEVEEALGENSQIVTPIIKIIYESMNELDGGDLKVSGMDRLLQYPEYSNKDQHREHLGAIGIIGPRRMDYAKVVATIEGLAGNVESILNESTLMLNE